MHATVLLQANGNNIYIDPAQGALDGMPPADLILITDIHGDHMSGRPSPGQLFHDKGRGNGYILTYGGNRFYFSGGTEAIPEIEALKNIDVAFVCMNLPYTITPEEAAAGVKAFHPAIVYPYHYKGSGLKAFAAGLAGTGIDVRLREWYPN